MGRFLAILLSLCVILPADADEHYQSSPQRQEAPVKDWGPWFGPYRAKIVGMMAVDFGEQYLYAAANAALPAPAGERRVVFLGDSITDGWNLAKFFPGKPYINRGIGGQVTTQMLVRFSADVVALHPKAVVILAGTNDLGGGLQVESTGQIEANYRAMAQLAESNGIKPIFTALTPVNNYTDNARTMLDNHDPRIMAEINDWLAEFCAEHHYGFIDYGPALRDSKGLLAAQFTSDGLHPNEAAYEVMAPVAADKIAYVLGAEDYDSQKVTALPPNGLALTPPMGWNSWNKFACNISEATIRASADAMVSSGMKDAGYHYVLIDDCWQGERDAAGDIQPDPQKFPSGIKALADYVHGKGLLLGIYSDAGTKTCGGRPGSRGHEYRDARQYAAWGVDYLKYDWCFTETQDGPSSYRTMADALRATHRPIVFSACEWGTAKPWMWGASQGANLWRATGDIMDRWDGRKDYSLGVMTIVDLVEPLHHYAGPGHWNDPDMLEVGNGGMSETEYRSHFSLWAELAAPLIAGNDIANMPPAIKAILTNKEVIAIDQDPAGIQGHRVLKGDGWEIWSKTLADGGQAILLLNRGDKSRNVAAKWSELGLYSSPKSVRDLWKGKDLPAGEEVSATLESHAVAMFRVRS
jgi:alpha-galactosidase